MCPEGSEMVPDAARRTPRGRPEARQATPPAKRARRDGTRDGGGGGHGGHAHRGCGRLVGGGIMPGG